MYSRWMRNGFIWLLVVVAAIAIGFAFFSGGDSKQEVPFGQVVQDIEGGLIETLEVDGRDINAIYFQHINGQPLEKKSKVAENTDIATFLSDRGISLSGASPGRPASIASTPRLRSSAALTRNPATALASGSSAAGSDSRWRTYSSRCSEDLSCFRSSR